MRVSHFFLPQCADCLNYVVGVGDLAVSKEDYVALPVLGVLLFLEEAEKRGVYFGSSKVCLEFANGSYGLLDNLLGIKLAFREHLRKTGSKTDNIELRVLWQRLQIDRQSFPCRIYAAS